MYSYVMPRTTKSKLQDSYYVYSYVDVPHDQIKPQTAQTIRIILCIVMSCPTRLTIHNIYYAPFVYIAPAGKKRPIFNPLFLH